MSRHLQQNVRRWLLAIRPRTLVLSLAPVLAGIALAMAQTGALAIWTALGTALAALGIQIGTNLHNDAVDFERGTDGPDRLGPARAAAQGWFTPAQVRRAAHLAFGLSLLLGLALVIRGGWPILALGLVSIAAGYAYTSGPRPIAYGPFGELFVLAFFGIAAVVGTYYLQTLAVTGTALVLGLAFGLPAAAVLLLNNYRDEATDRVAGRHTLVMVLGRPAARSLYAALVLLPIALLLLALPLGAPGEAILAPVLGPRPEGVLPGIPGVGVAGAHSSYAPAPAWVAAPLVLAVPLALRLIRRLRELAEGGPGLNALLAATGQYQAALALLYIAALLLSQFAA